MIRDFDITNKPVEQRLFKAQEIADMCHVHFTTVFLSARRINAERIVKGHKVFFPYLSMKKICEDLKSKGNKVTEPKERDNSLITDPRCFDEFWFPDPIPKCLKDEWEE